MSAMLRLLRIAVVLAAGAGAWFGYERFAAAEESNVPAENAGDAASTAPWSDLDLVVADEIWDGPTFTSVQPPDDVVRQSMAFDPESGRVQMSLFGPQGSAEGLVEVDANEVFVKEPGGAWQSPTPDAVVSESVLRSSAATGRPPTLADLVPKAVWPYTVILSDVPGAGSPTSTRVLTIRMKGGAFAAAQPALAAQWRSNANHPGGRVEIEVEVDADGHVVAVRNLAPDDNVQYRFAPISSAPTFQAPFVD